MGKLRLREVNEERKKRGKMDAETERGKAGGQMGEIDAEEIEKGRWIQRNEQRWSQEDGCRNREREGELCKETDREIAGERWTKISLTEGQVEMPLPASVSGNWD